MGKLRQSSTTAVPAGRNNRETAGPGHLDPPALPPLYSVDAVATHLGVSTKTVRRWIDDGTLPFYRFGKQIRIGEPDLLAFIRDRRKA